MPLGHTSFAKEAMVPEAEKTGSAPEANRPAKHLLTQAAIDRHLLQSTGTGACDGQHGIPTTMLAVMSSAAISWTVMS